ncbi:MAG TPA: hypothetical protein VNQ73_16510 [Ilumatobacter sp.]|nr:hypothetical protein [Ilumatobacter sp.]
MIPHSEKQGLLRDWQHRVADAINTDLPRGVIGWAHSPGNDSQTGISGATAITNLAVTWDPEPNRVYRTTVQVTVSKTTGGIVTLQIDNGSGTVVHRSSQSLVNTEQGTLVAVRVEVTGAGPIANRTRRARIASTGGTVDILGADGRNGSIVVEDLGPA